MPDNGPRGVHLSLNTMPTQADARRFARAVAENVPDDVFAMMADGHQTFLRDLIDQGMYEQAEAMRAVLDAFAHVRNERRQLAAAVDDVFR